jgi:hypothetical protein
MLLTVLLNGTQVCAGPIISRPCIFTASWARPSPADSPLNGIPRAARGAVGHLINFAERTVLAAYALTMPVSALTWADADFTRLVDHLEGRPRVIVGHANSDAEFWTPQLFGKRIVIPTRAQDLRSGQLRPGAELRLVVDHDAATDIEPIHLAPGAFSTRVQFADAVEEIAPAGVAGFFAVSVAVAPAPGEVDISITSRLDGNVVDKTWRTASPGRVDVAFRLGGDHAGEPWLAIGSG